MNGNSGSSESLVGGGVILLKDVYRSFDGDRSLSNKTARCIFRYNLMITLIVLCYTSCKRCSIVLTLQYKVVITLTVRCFITNHILGMFSLILHKEVSFECEGGTWKK